MVAVPAVIMATDASRMMRVAPRAPSAAAPSVPTVVARPPVHAVAAGAVPLPAAPAGGAVPPAVSEIGAAAASAPMPISMPGPAVAPPRSDSVGPATAAPPLDSPSPGAAAVRGPGFSISTAATLLLGPFSQTTAAVVSAGSSGPRPPARLLRLPPPRLVPPKLKATLALPQITQ